MSADSPVILREKITADYNARPVSRQFDGRQPGPGIPGCRFLPES